MRLAAPKSIFAFTAKMSNIFIEIRITKPVMLERSEASKISKPVISTTARRRRVVEGFARKNLKNHETVILTVGAGSARPKNDAR